MKYFLLTCITFLFVGCVLKKSYPSNWASINMQCSEISGVYKNQNEKKDTFAYEDLYSSLFPYINLKESVFDIRNVKFIRLEKEKDIISVFALDKDYTVLNSTELNILSNCKDGLIHIEYKRDEQGIFRDGLIGYVSNKLTIGNDKKESLILKFDGIGVGMYGPLPLMVVGNDWYRFSKSK